MVRIATEKLPLEVSDSDLSLISVIELQIEWELLSWGF